MKKLHVVRIEWNEYDNLKRLSYSVGYYLGERKGDLLIANCWSSAMSLHPVVSHIPKSKVTDVKTICLMEI